MAEFQPAFAPERLFWTRRVALTTRILAVNIIALALLAGSLFYLDSIRNQLLAERFRLAQAEAEVTARALAIATSAERRTLIAEIGRQQHLRLRLYNGKGDLVADSFALGSPSFRFANPAGEPWFQQAARGLDRGMDFILGAPPIDDYVEPARTDARSWPEIAQALVTGMTAVRQRRAPDRTPVISAASPLGKSGFVLLTTRNATDVTQKIRDARQTLAIIVGAALGISILLSLFLARTIVQPLRSLVRAAVRVRLGRDRSVVVPRLPERRDEIGMLARAFSDMTNALRRRIDAVESFAADVAHEIKNPLASLRSALESLEKVEDPELRRQLTDIAAHDVRRIDRLVTEIADVSRIDAELSRTAFEIGRYGHAGGERPRGARETRGQWRLHGVDLVARIRQQQGFRTCSSARTRPGKSARQRRVVFTAGRCDRRRTRNRRRPKSRSALPITAPVSRPKRARRCSSAFIRCARRVRALDTTAVSAWR